MGKLSVTSYYCSLSSETPFWGSLHFKEVSVMPMPINMEVYFSENALREAFNTYVKTKRDRIHSDIIKIPIGADGITYEDFQKNIDRNIREISSAVLQGKYFFYPLRQIDIDKDERDPSRGKRTLSIGRIRDTLVQKQLYQALIDPTETWFKKKHLDRVSLAYRPSKSVHHAIRGIWRDFQKGYNYALDADIKQFFDTLDHQYLLSVVDSLVEPSSIERKLIFRYIKTSYVKYSEYEHLDIRQRKTLFASKKPPNPQLRKRGIPQGGVLSGMLANLYLHNFDRWIVEVLGRVYQLRYYRYADDFVILTKNEADAKELYDHTSNKLSEIHLCMHDLESAKTRIVHIPTDSLDFLGFRITDKHIQVKPQNIKRFKSNFKKSIKRIQKHTTVDPKAIIAEIIKYYAASKVLGPSDKCESCGLPKRPRNWISFFAPVVTDTRQLHHLDVWMRREIERYMFRRFKIRIKNRQTLLKAQMPSLLQEYWKYKKTSFCKCEFGSHRDYTTDVQVFLD